MGNKERKNPMKKMLAILLALLMMLTGITNIRDVIPFPRTPGSLEF